MVKIVDSIEERVRTASFGSAELHVVVQSVDPCPGNVWVQTQIEILIEKATGAYQLDVSSLSDTSQLQ
jgi:hypothetical protein